MRRRLALVGVAALLTGVLGQPAVAGSAPPRVAAVRSATPPTIDGRADEAAWQAAPAVSAFTQLYPDEAASPTQATEVRVLYDDEAVYVAVVLHDSQPDRVVARVAPRDREIETDHVTIAFDSQRDGTTARWFRLSAAAVQSDGMLFDDDASSSTWDAVWSGTTSRDADGWTAEFKIPLSILRFSPALRQDWGFQVTRFLARRRESSVLAFAPTSTRGTVSKFGVLIDLERLRPRRYFELQPFALIGARAAATGSAVRPRAADLLANVGVDLKLGLSSDTILDLTVSPDFGMVDVDEVVLNLSRYELFLPEKRPFFLDGADVFSTPIALFHSRRIGQPVHDVVGGATVDVPRIWSAAKAVGRLGEHARFGLLQALTGSQHTIAFDDQGALVTRHAAPPMSYSVAAGRYMFGSASHVGLMTTARVRAGDGVVDPRADHDSVVASIDGQWQSADGAARVNSQWVGSKLFDVATFEDSQGARCEPTVADECAPIVRVDGTPIRADGLGQAATVAASYEGRHLVASGRHAAFSSQFDANDLGFHPQVNRQLVEVSAGYRNLEPGRLLRRKGAFLEGFGQFRFDGTPLEWGNVLRVEGESQRQTTYVLRPYLLHRAWDLAETGDGARFETLPNAGMTLQLGTNPERATVVTLAGWAGTDLGASRYWDANISPTLQLRLHDRLDLSLSATLAANWNMTRAIRCLATAGTPCRVDTIDRTYVFGEARVGAASATLRAAYTLSPRVFIQAYTQLFVSRSAFGRFREVTTVGTHPELRRDALRTSGFDPDQDGDGASDLDEETRSLTLRLQSVWEYRSGSRLSAAYTRSPAASAPGSQATSGPVDHVLVAKLTYFWR